MLIAKKEDYMYLSSERVSLRTVKKEDLLVLSELMTNHEIAKLTGEVHPLTEKHWEDFYHRTQSTDDRIWFLIVDKETGDIIGETGFLRINMPWRTSDYSLVIWDKSYWGRGYGKEVARLMFDYAFNYLNLNRLAIGVVGFNHNGLRFWESVGFIEEGKQIDGYFCNGEYSDFIMMYLLEKDYRQSSMLLKGKNT